VLIFDGLWFQIGFFSHAVRFRGLTHLFDRRLLWSQRVFLEDGLHGVVSIRAVDIGWVLNNSVKVSISGEFLLTLVTSTCGLRLIIALLSLHGIRQLLL
jgi:hypothetical protein